MRTFDSILNHQPNAFGDTESGCFYCFQNTDNQYRYSYKITSNSTGKELDVETGFSYFSARYLDHTLTTAWLSVDPMADKYPSVSPYAYCVWNPMKLIDPDGRKDRPFREGIDQRITPESGTSTPLRLRFGIYIYPNKEAYNCHSYAWHNSLGDPNHPKSDEYRVDGVLLPRWDNSPADDIIEQKAIQLKSDEDNICGDIVIYYWDSDKNGRYDDGEVIIHSAIVVDVDDEGYTTLVRAKRGADCIAENHPDAPYYYDKYNGEKTSRAYFRIPQHENKPIGDSQDD